MFPREPALRRSVGAAFAAGRSPGAPPPGFGRRVPVELLAGTRVPSRAEPYVTRAAAEAPANELPAGRRTVR